MGANGMPDFDDPEGVNDWLDSVPKEDAPPPAPAEDEAPDNVYVMRSRTQMPPASEGVNLSDFYAYMPAGNYIFAPAREFWPAGSVNHRVPPQPLLDRRGRPVLDEKKKQVFITASAWLSKERAVEQMTWAPGEPMIIEDRLISEGGWIRRPGCSCFNLYRPPIVTHGDATKAKKWIDHICRVYPNDANHIIAWLAHRVQKPQEKINHALVLGGNQGVGKDTMLEPVKYGVGAWNVSEVSPQQLLGRFNGFLKSVIMRVSEARDLGERDRYSFYEHMKTYTAAPPDVLRVDEKHTKEHSIFNVVGVIITTNNKTDGLYIPADDRRHYVAWSDLTKEDFSEEYWRDLWGWYDDGGRANVAEFLRTLNISGFNPKAPPPKTPAWHDIVNSNRAPEDAELADALDGIGWPNAVTISQIATSLTCAQAFAEYIRDRRNSRKLPHRLEAVGYIAVHNAHAKDGLWKVGGKRQVVYARKDMSERDRIKAADGMTSAPMYS